MLSALKHNKHLYQQVKKTPRWSCPLTLQTILLASISFSALAIEPIPEKTGVNGYANFGAMAVKFKSNLLAEVVSINLSPSTTNSLDKEPENKDILLPSFRFQLSYTWADSRTQVYFGNQLEDFLRFDLITRTGIRKEFGGAGVFGMEVITTAIKTKVWNDPYAINVKRDSTNYARSGARLIWDRILGSAAKIRVSSLEVQLDNEQSGRNLGLPAADRELINREGDINRFDIEYAFSLGKGRLFVPRVKFIEFDLDGEAMAHDDTELEFVYAGPVGTLRYLTGINFGKHEYDVVNPIFRIKDEADTIGMQATLVWPNAFGLKDWKGNATLAFFSRDHDIDFYDTRTAALRVGTIYRF